MAAGRSCGFRMTNIDPVDLRPGKGGSWGIRHPNITLQSPAGCSVDQPNWKHEYTESDCCNPQRSNTGRCREGQKMGRGRAVCV